MPIACCRHRSSRLKWRPLNEGAFMKFRSTILLTIFLAMTGCANKHKNTHPTTLGSSTQPMASTESWQEAFDVDKSDLSPRGMSNYMILMPGRRAEYQSKDGKLIITVLAETKTVDGVQTAIVE